MLMVKLSEQKQMNVFTESNAIYCLKNTRNTHFTDSYSLMISGFTELKELYRC